MVVLLFLARGRAVPSILVDLSTNGIARIRQPPEKKFYDGVPRGILRRVRSQTGERLGRGWQPDPEREQRLRWWDGAGWTPDTVYVSQQVALGRSVPRWGTVVVVLLLVTAVLNGAAAVADLHGLGLLPGPEGFDAPLRVRYDAYDEQARRLLGLTWVTYMVTVPAWVAWQYHLAELAPAPLVRDTPEMQAGAWFVPVLNLWRPVRDLAQVWRALGRARAPWGLLGAWWAAWTVLLVSFPAGLSLWIKVGSVPQMRDYLHLALAGEVLAALTALLAAAVVVRFSRLARAYVGELRRPGS
jgi:hypothetical protein